MWRLNHLELAADWTQYDEGKGKINDNFEVVNSSNQKESGILHKNKEVKTRGDLEEKTECRVDTSSRQVIT